IDDCRADSCNYRGTCVDGIHTFTCKCNPLAKGTYCDEVISICSDEARCGNNATCVDGTSNYTCHCQTGSMGYTCRINFDYCHSRPCQNGGQCINWFNEYYCVCQNGFDGKYCENGRGFHVLSAVTVTYSNKQFLAIKATLGASGRSVNSSWCEDYYWLCKSRIARPV
ncbi:hypothetical protein QZH41_014300, partial [Actinostola sp. cb2023]